MKFKVTMKDPDTLHDAITEAVKEEVNQLLDDPDEREALQETREKKVHDICKEWFEYGEYLTVEIDTESKTIRVCEAAE